jgi:transcriptional regulator with XRE-family HTH domain
VSNLSEALGQIQQGRKLSGLDLASFFGVSAVMVSRLLNDRQPVGHGTIARLIVKLEPAEASRLLQAYFDDELERIREGRDAKAMEMGMRSVNKNWPHRVRVESVSEPKRTNGKRS